MDNLAIIADNPSALPYLNPPSQSRTTIQRTAGTTFGMQWGLFAALQHVANHGLQAASFPVTAVTRTTEPLVVSQLSPGFQGTQQTIEEWDTSLLLDPIRSIVMQGLYRKVLGYPLSTPFQLRLLQKFFYDYPNDQFNDGSMLYPDGLMPPYLAVQEVVDRQNAFKAQVDVAVQQYAVSCPKKPSSTAAGPAGPTSKPPFKPGEPAPESKPPPKPAEDAAVEPVPRVAPLDDADEERDANRPAQETCSCIDAAVKNVLVHVQQGIIDHLKALPLCNPSQECTKNLALGLAQKVIDEGKKSGLPCETDPDKLFRRAVLNATVAIQTLQQQMQVERPLRERGDTYANYNAEFRELYHSLQPGWVGRGTRKDVPKNACYVGHHGKTYVWVMTEHLKQLTNLTIAIVDAATTNTATTTLATSPVTGGPPTLTAVPAAGAKPKAGEPATSYVVPMSTGPTSRGAVVPGTSGGVNVVPAPPVPAGIFR
jgi:hypothetical protein